MVYRLPSTRFVIPPPPFLLFPVPPSCFPSSEYCVCMWMWVWMWMWMCACGVACPFPNVRVVDDQNQSGQQVSR
jgi:hypothetical protein